MLGSKWQYSVSLRLMQGSQGMVLELIIQSKTISAVRLSRPSIPHGDVPERKTKIEKRCSPFDLASLAFCATQLRAIALPRAVGWLAVLGGVAGHVLSSSERREVIVVNRITLMYKTLNKCWKGVWKAVQRPVWRGKQNETRRRKTSRPRIAPSWLFVDEIMQKLLIVLGRKCPEHNKKV